MWGCALKGIEAAIRKALSKPGMADPLQRERVYASARQALANGIDKQGLGGTDRAMRQSDLLEELIARIEDSYWAEPPPPDLGFASAAADEPPADDPARELARPEPPAEDEEVAAVPPAPDRRARGAERVEPDFDDLPRPPRSAPSFEDVPPPIDDSAPGQPQEIGEPVEFAQPSISDEPVQPAPGHLDPIEVDAPVDPPEAGPTQRRRHASAPAASPPDHLIADVPDADFGPVEPPPRHGGRRKKRRRPIFSLILVVSLVVAFVGIGALWLTINGVLQTPQQRDTSVPNPPATVDAEDFAGLPSPDGAFSGDWIDVFTPSDLATVAGRDAANLSLLDNEGRDALRVVSQSGGAEGEVLFELGPGLLQSLSGAKSMVAVTLRSSGDTPTQIYVRCQLPGGGDCGRHRFDVTYEAGDVIFSFDLGNAGNATEPGYLALNSDITGAGNGVDVYGIRIRPQ